MVRILERGESGSPGGAELRCRFAFEEVVPGALGGIARRDIVRRGQEPRLGVAVTLIADTDRTVDVRDDGHRARVAPGC